MTALIRTSDAILDDIARSDVDFAVRLYTHRRLAGTPAGYRWHRRTDTDVCDACAHAERGHWAERAYVRHHYPERRLTVLADEQPSDAARAETLAYFTRSLSTATSTAVHSAAVGSAA